MSSTSGRAGRSRSATWPSSSCRSAAVTPRSSPTTAGCAPATARWSGCSATTRGPVSGAGGSRRCRWRRGSAVHQTGCASTSTGWRPRATRSERQRIRRAGVQGRGAVTEPDPPRPDLADLGRVHFVGIGGAGMSGVARIMLARGVEVSGCDTRDSRALAALRARGAAVHVGHAPEHVVDVDTVVASTAIRADSVELVRAGELGHRVLPRAGALAAVMAGLRGVAVAGTHGKTTTTSMLTVALQACGRDPSYAIGGDLTEPGSDAHAGTGEFFIAEADESDRPFLLLSPEAAVVTNVEADHLDNYGDAQAVHDSFREFVSRIAADGYLAVGADDEGSLDLASIGAARGLRVLTFGQAADADVRVADLRLDAGQ